MAKETKRGQKVHAIQAALHAHAKAYWDTVQGGLKSGGQSAAEKATREGGFGDAWMTGNPKDHAEYWAHDEQRTAQLMKEAGISDDDSWDTMMQKLQEHDQAFKGISQYGGADEGARKAYKDAGGTLDEDQIPEDPAATAMKERQGRLDQIQGQLQKFADEMNMPLDQVLKTDQYAKASQQNALAASGQDALLGGSGGLAASGASKTMNDALVGYGMQRRQLGLQALGQTGEMAGQAANNAQQWAQFQGGLDMNMQQMQDQASQQAFQAQQGQNRGIGSAIGAGIGALGFIGGPALGAATMAGGAALGGGLGGMATGSYSPYQYKRSKATGNRGAYGLGGPGNV